MEHVLPEVKRHDVNKTVGDMVDDFFDHCGLKSDVSRNMLQNLYFKDPLQFHENDDVQKVLRNNIAWPIGYIPEQHVIKKIIVRESEQEQKYKVMKEKHQVEMKDSTNVDRLLNFPLKLSELKNAFKTYKDQSWKTSFNKYRDKEMQIRMNNELEFRAKLEAELKEALISQVI